MSNTKFGLLAQYENPAQIYAACERVRDAGYTKWDACTPFPVHGLDRAMGLKPSPLPWWVFGIAISGSIFMICFQIWAMVYAYPFVLAGKPLFSIPAYVPAWYEWTVLSACLTAFLGNWVINGLPRLYHPAFASKSFARVTDDKFFIIIERRDPQFDMAKAKALLQDTGATSVEELED
jgi:Protein of unknown function (DUF3341)